MPFYEIEFPLAPLSEDDVEAALAEAGALSVTLVDRGDEPVLEPKPGEIRLWPDTLIRALFDQSSDPALALSLLIRRLGAHLEETARVRGVEDQVWERACLKDLKPMRFGRRLWVVPTSVAGPSDEHAVVVHLDPGLAFGTGSHPTTALCLQVLESLPVAGQSVIDYGCGSGILGIAALKLGAAHVCALDIDPQALVASRENAFRNGVAERIEVLGADAKLDPAFLVLSNILAGPLVELAPRLTAACAAGGHLVLSGLLRTQAHVVRAAYSAGFDMVRTVERDEWCCIYARRAA
ncbi:MAG TPA: 50S ribosomal protein L11 methyltransferase [Steroidobacteraceae bacterium]|jgi:ribosomal protein L11 methyltransferase